MRDFKDLKIAVAGTGYVGLSIATLLSQHHKVMAVDIVPEKAQKMKEDYHLTEAEVYDDHQKILSRKERTEFNCNTGCKGSI